jgi:hypothetical protein
MAKMAQAAMAIAGIASWHGNEKREGAAALISVSAAASRNGINNSARNQHGALSNGGGVGMAQPGASWRMASSSISANGGMAK